MYVVHHSPGRDAGPGSVCYPFHCMPICTPRITLYHVYVTQILRKLSKRVFRQKASSSFLMIGVLNLPHALQAIELALN